MQNKIRDSQIVYASACDPADKVPRTSVASFNCPRCGAYCQQQLGHFKAASTRTINGSGQFFTSQAIGIAQCTGCTGISLFSGFVQIWPVSTSQAPKPTADLPAELVDDFNEARDICSRSPRGAAALLRLVVQKLCPILGATEPDINKAIGSLVAQGKIAPLIQKALDSVRVIGNEAVHPGELDLKDDLPTALALFDLINFIVEKAITEPGQISALFESLPENKRKGIEQRDGAAPQATLGQGGT